MSRKKRKYRAAVKARDEPVKATGNEKRITSWFCTQEAYDLLCSNGYRRLSDCPEVLMAVNYIANLISSMTIYLMENTSQGDIRIKNGLSRTVDVTPNPPMTRRTWMYTIIRNMLLEGDGNSVVMPVFANTESYLDRLIPLPPADVSFTNVTAAGYTIMYKGRAFDPTELLHFVWYPNPNTPYIGQGVRFALRDIVDTLKQSSTTKKAFMESKWKPSVIVKVDALAEEFSGPEGRDLLLDEYIANNEAGKPWVIPSEFMEIQQVKPLSLQDLALNEATEIDKKAVAALFGVPAYVVGAGSFDKNEHNNFINSTIMPIAQGVQQTLTNGILYSQNLFFRFNPRSLYAYNINEISMVAARMMDRIAMTRNEARDWIGYEPREDMEELLGLENFIPADKLGDQKKLNSGGGEA